MLNWSREAMVVSETNAPSFEHPVGGVARIVHGVHFPADIVGGWSLGIVLGVVVTCATGRRSAF